MPVSRQYRCILVHVPKCAGTSMECALGMRADHDTAGLEEHPLLNFKLNEDLFGQVSYRVSAQHFTINEIQQFKENPQSNQI